MASRISTTRPHQSITFSQYSELAFIHREENASKLSYTSQDYDMFKRTLIEDARRISREDETRAPIPHHHERVGIEVFLSQDLARQVDLARRSHVRAVLQEQELQKQRGICDVEKLSSVSSQKSFRSQERARILAIAYWLQHIFDQE